MTDISSRLKNKKGLAGTTWASIITGVEETRRVVLEREGLPYNYEKGKPEYKATSYDSHKAEP